MSWSFYPAKAGFPEFAADWDELNRRLYRGHPFLDTAFVGPLVNHFAAADDILAMHRTGGVVDAMLLLHQPAHGICASFLPSQAQIAPALLQSTEPLHTLLRSLPRFAVALDLLCQDPEHSITAALASYPGHEASAHATTTATSLVGTFKAYWQARSRKLREQIRRTLKKAEENGLKPRLEVASEPDTLKERLKRYGLLESRGWKGQAGTAIHPGNVQGRFYEEVLLRFGKRSRSFVYELYMGDHLAASQLLIGNDYMLIGLKTTYDEALAVYSPGRLVHYLLLEREYAAQRFQVLEYYTNASAETLRWGTGQRVITHHRLYCYPWMLRLAMSYRNLKKLLTPSSHDRKHDAAPLTQEAAEEDASG